MRKVKLFEWVKPEGATKWNIEDTGRVATFHTFSVDYEECNEGVGNYPVAIVEHEDGTVEAIPIPLIRFIS